MHHKYIKTLSFAILLGGVTSLSPLVANADDATCQQALHTYNQLVEYGKSFGQLVKEFQNQVSTLTKSDFSQFETAKIEFDNKVSALPQKYGVTLSQYPATVQSIKTNCPMKQWPKKLRKKTK